ncbi:hypothetical protein PIROE2DRAFT_10342, partial [Piromyces sp. E2]
IEFLATDPFSIDYKDRNIFTRFFYFPYEDQYYISPIPGEKEEDIQKKHIIDHGKHSALNDIYYDDELCSKIDCELFRNLQLISRPTFVMNDYDEYSSKDV